MFNNKKVINLYQLTISLIAILTYVMPINKVYYDSGKSATIGTVFVVLNILMLICLLTIVAIAVYNLFKDNYNNLKIINSLSFMSLLFVSVNLSVYSLNLFYALSGSYIILFYELILLNVITQINGFIWSYKSIKKEFKKLRARFRKKKVENKHQSMLKTDLLIKRRAENKPDIESIEDEEKW